MRLCLIAVATAMFSFPYSGFAFEDAQVLPAGVRRAELKFFYARIDSTTDNGGQMRGLGGKLERDITFKDFVQMRQGAERRQLQGFLTANGIDESSIVGKMKADVTGVVNVIAPTFSIGVSDRFSFGLALPYYLAATDAKVAFEPNARADEFVELLASPRVGMAHKALEAVDSINGVVDALDEKLERSGFEKLGKWNKQGLGDALLKGKYKYYDNDTHRSAVDFGVRLPTGRTDDPDVLTDIQFGDGTFDIFSGIMYDFRLASVSPYTPFFVNMFGRYTYQVPAVRKVRMKTETEVIEVPVEKVDYKLGDFIEAGASLQLDLSSGFLGGVGYQYFHKAKDHYDAGESSKFYEEDTRQWAHKGEALIGYSSVNAFQKGTVSVPFTSYLVYERQLKSINMPVQHMVQLDLKVYF